MDFEEEKVMMRKVKKYFGNACVYIRNYFLDYNFFNFQIVPSTHQLLSFIILVELYNIYYEDSLYNEKSIYLFNLYKTFRVDIISPWLLLIVQAIYSIIIFSYMHTIYTFGLNLFVIFIFLFILIFVLIPFWILTYIRFVYNRTKCLQSGYYNYFCALEASILLGFVIAISIIIMLSIIENNFNCNMFMTVGMRVIDLIIIIQVSPLLLSRVFSYIQGEVMCIAYLIVLMVITFGFLVGDNELSVIQISFTLFSTYFIHIICQFQVSYIFLITNRYHDIMGIRTSEIEESSRKLSEEMKNMITSLSHDLKSPLAAFSCGIDAIKQVSNEVIESLNGLCNNCIPLKDGITVKLKLMQSLIRGIFGSYQILLMIINRCTDYTRTINKNKLTPHFEVLSIRNSIQQAIDHIHDFKGKVDVILDPIDSSIEDLIYTDKQWFMDNLLCLISNAVKFTYDGYALVRAYIVDNPKEKDSQDQMIMMINSYLNEKYIVRNICFNNKYDMLESINYKSGAYTVLSRSDESDDNDDVKVECEPMLQIEVEDSGIGVDPDEAKNLFLTPDLSKQRGEGGSGLGLYCLAARIKSLKGDCGLSIRKNNQQGSLFWFRIPYKIFKGNIPNIDKNYENRSELNLENFQDHLNMSFFGHHLNKTETSDNESVSSVSDTSQALSLNKSCLVPDSDALSIGSNPITPVSDKIAMTPRIIGSTQLEGELFPKLRILVVDDSLPILRMLKLTLQNLGHIVDIARNGLEALVSLNIFNENQVDFSNEAIKNESRNVEKKHRLRTRIIQHNKFIIGKVETKNYDVILMDLQMPVIDGFEAIRKIRIFEENYVINKNKFLYAEVETTQSNDGDISMFPQAVLSENFPLHMFIVAMSANKDEETIKKAFYAGADSFIPKPFNINSFYTSIKDYLT